MSSFSSCSIGSDASVCDHSLPTSNLLLVPAISTNEIENSDQTALVQAFKGFVRSKKVDAKDWRTEREVQHVYYDDSEVASAKSPKLSFSNVRNLMRKLNISRT